MPEGPAHMPRRAAIVGCGAVTAVGCGVEALRSALRNNTSGLGRSARFEHPRYQSSVVGAALLDALNSQPDDPAWALASEAANQARQEAAPTLARVAADRLGLVLSTTKANIEALERLAEGRPCSESARRHLQADRLAEDLAGANGVQGPVQTVSVACVSGLVALQQGAKLIQRGAADAVIVVGVDHLSAFVVAGFSALKALALDGCRPFDQGRYGISPGEAGAAVVLADSELLAGPGIVLRGWGSSNDANHLTGPSRDGAGLARAIRVALETADLAPQEVDYINAHGTGTAFNDAMECQALRGIFGESCPPLSACKGMLGHTLGAAGVVEAILCVLALQERRLPGTPRLEKAAEGTPGSLLLEPRSAGRLRHVLKLNTGFGGVNGALVLSYEDGTRMATKG